MATANVELALGDKTYTLVPTYRALEQISQRFGGHVKAIESIRSLDVQAMVLVTKAGVPKLKDAEVKELPRLIYEAGVVKASVPLIQFLAVLANGGKPLPDGDEEEGGETATTGEG